MQGRHFPLRDSQAWGHLLLFHLAAEGCLWPESVSNEAQSAVPHALPASPPAEGRDQSGLQESRLPASGLQEWPPSAGAEAPGRTAVAGDFSFAGGTVKIPGPGRVSFSLSRAR